MKPIASIALSVLFSVSAVTARAAPTPDSTALLGGLLGAGSGSWWEQDALEVDTSTMSNAAGPVDIDGDIAVAGFSHEVQMFRKRGLNWEKMLTINAPTYSNNSFGASLALSDDTLVVGAPDAVDSKGREVGAVYVFKISGKFVLSLARLDPDTDHTGSTRAVHGGKFGTSVAIDDGIIVVGAPGERARTMSVRETKRLAHVFKLHSDNSVSQLTPITAVQPKNATLGQFVGVSANTMGTSMAIALSYSRYLATEDVYRTLVFEPAPPSGGLGQGDDAGWDEVARFGPSDDEDTHVYGKALAMDGNTIVVGARFAVSPSGLEAGGKTGGADVFVKLPATSTEPTRWRFLQQIQGSADPNGALFGSSVSVDGNTIAAGAPMGVLKGSVYIFTRSGTSASDLFTEQAQLHDSGHSQGDNFGWYVAVDNHTVVAKLSKNVYWAKPPKMFFFHDATCSVKALNHPYGTSKAGTYGMPVLTAANKPILGSFVKDTLSLTNAYPGSTPYLYIGTEADNRTLDGGTLLVKGTPRLCPPISSSGKLLVALPTLPSDPSLCGVALYYQFVFYDPGAGGTYHMAMTRGLIRIYGSP